jgi:glycosyltransferase involved in cell wall biosynthesis
VPPSESNALSNHLSSQAAPIVSVIIPTYNRADDVSRCLDALCRQTFRDFEVIVCDDGSTDHTAKVVAAFSTRLNLVYDVDANWGGPARPRNRGIARARGRYVAFLDADDWWTSEKLEASVPALDHGADVVYHHLYAISRHGQRRTFRRVRARDVTAPVFRDLLINENALPLSSVVARRSVITAAGGMPEDRSVIAMEDYLCWLNVAKITERFVRVPGTHGYYWMGGGNISSDKRTLSLLKTLESIYAAELTERDGSLPAWIQYARGRALYRLGAYDEARDLFAQIRLTTSSASVAAKTVLMRLLTSVPRKQSGI